jgi:xanthine/CO dehydrogenase XdhC/CoxF family maturation factor
VSRPDDLALLRVLAEVIRSGERCALATIVRTRGSTPRKMGTKMLVIPSRGLVGTVGGGCGEAEVLEAALRVLDGGGPELVTVDLTRDLLSWSPAVCGGTMEVFVEAVQPRDHP